MAKPGHIAMILIVVLVATVSASWAQESATASTPETVTVKQDKGALINVDYSIAAPLGATREYTSNGSPQGLGIDVRFHKQHFKLGIGASWQVFRDEVEEPQTPSGARYEARTTSLVPVLATAYFVLDYEGLMTFVGVGGGAMLSRQTIDIQADETSENTWYVAGTGLAGALLEVTPGFALESKVRYTGGFKNGYKSIGMLQLTLGFTFIY